MKKNLTLLVGLMFLASCQTSYENSICRDNSEKRVDVESLPGLYSSDGSHFERIVKLEGKGNYLMTDVAGKDPAQIYACEFNGKTILEWKMLEEVPEIFTLFIYEENLNSFKGLFTTEESAKASQVEFEIVESAYTQSDYPLIHFFNKAGDEEAMINAHRRVEDEEWVFTKVSE